MDAPDLSNILDNERKDKIITFAKDFILTSDQITELRSVFDKKISLGMEQGLRGSCIQMENTQVPELTNGKEEGVFLAMDLGSSNFRIIRLEMKAGKIIEENVENYEIPEERRTGTGPDLFDFLAKCASQFMDKYPPSSSLKEIPLGFSFSFPMIQKALDCGILVTWTSRFSCSESVGKDAVLLLNNALQKIPNTKNIRVLAILNDATGTLVRGSYEDPRTAIGLIIGTGCNGAYIEKGHNVVRWEDGKKSDYVIMDPEWGAFGDDGCIDFIKTKFDSKVDAISLIPKSFTYEKYFSGNFIGDLFRLVLLGLTMEKLIFDEKAVNILGERCINAEDVSALVAEDGREGAEKILKRLNLFNDKTFSEDFGIMNYIAEILSERAAVLISVPCSDFLERMKRPFVAIAVTGSMYKYHPKLKAYMEKYISRFAPTRPFKFILSDDGSGKGAGLVAAISQRLNMAK